MNIQDIITIFALFLGPLLAVQVQTRFESKRECKNRKLYIFNTLMSTRATRLSQYHVAALNMIDIEFYNEKPIIDAWKIYHYHLNERIEGSDESANSAWSEKGTDQFIDLLYVMAQYLKYDFDKIQLKAGCYLPIAHSELENNQNKLLQGIVAVLDGKKAIPFSLMDLSTSQLQEKNKNRFIK